MSTITTDQGLKTESGHNLPGANTGNKVVEQARETMDILYEISVLLNTGLDKESLAHCMSLCESGVNPEALAAVIKELKRESKSIKA